MDKAKYFEILENCKKNNAKLVAVSKTKPIEAIENFYALNQRIFGENKVQELVEKAQVLPQDIEWHFIGHLQRNKVKYIAPFVQLIHAVDSISLLKEIDKRALQNKRKVNCLIQFHIAKEESKFGLKPKEYHSFFSEAMLFENVNIVGVMGMATFTNNTQQIEQEFELLANTFSAIKAQFFASKKDFKEISMGMSGDYSIALAKGSTMVRIGSSIFGARQYISK